MTSLERMWVHSMAVTPATQGPSPWGDAVPPATVTINCFIEDKTQQVRNAEGDQVVSMTTVFAPMTWLTTLTPGSRCMVWGTREAFVISVARHQAGPDFADIEHIEAALT